MSKNDREDVNQNGIDDVIEPPIVDVVAGSQQLAERFQNNQATDPTLSGGDVDARWEDAESGDQTVGGSTAIPGQNVLDEMREATGVTYGDTEELKTGEKQNAGTGTDGNSIPLPKTTWTARKTRNSCHRLTAGTVSTGHDPSRMTWCVVDPSMATSSALRPETPITIRSLRLRRASSTIAAVALPLATTFSARRLSDLDGATDGSATHSRSLRCSSAALPPVPT